MGAPRAPPAGSLRPFLTHWSCTTTTHGVSHPSRRHSRGIPQCGLVMLGNTVPSLSRDSSPPCDITQGATHSSPQCPLSNLEGFVSYLCDSRRTCSLLGVCFHLFAPLVASCVSTSHGDCSVSSLMSCSPRVSRFILSCLCGSFKCLSP